MSYILVYSIITALAALILSTLAVVILRRVYMEGVYGRLDMERARFANFPHGNRAFEPLQA